MTLSFPVRRSLSLVPSVTVQRLTLFLCWAGLFGVVVAHFNSREKLNRLIIAAVSCGFALSFFGIVQRLTWNGKIYWVQGGNYDTAFASFVNRNSYAAFAGTLVPVAVCMTLAALRRYGDGDREAMPRLMLTGFAAVTITGGVFFSLSRGGILATAVSLALTLLLVLIYGGRRGRGPAIAVMGVIAVLSVAFLAWIGPEQVIERIGTLSKGQSVPSFSHRVRAWERAIPMWEDFETFGTGLGTFRYAFLKYAPPGGEWWTTAHNEYLELLCETGIIGGVIFLAGTAGYLFLVLRPWAVRRGSPLYLYVGLLTGIVGLLVHSAVSANLQTPANGLLLVLMGGALLRLVLMEEQERRAVPPGPRRIS
jgi:O-antigen ligase